MEIIINWAQIKDKDNLYNSLFEQLDSPSWHGKNLNALWDSISGGGINGVEPPYRVLIRNENEIPDDLIDFAEGVKNVFVDASRENDDIEIVDKTA